MCWYTFFSCRFYSPWRGKHLLLVVGKLRAMRVCSAQWHNSILFMRKEEGDKCTRLPFLRDKQEEMPLNCGNEHSWGNGRGEHMATHHTQPCSCWHQRWIKAHWSWQGKDQTNNSLWHEQQRDWYGIEGKTLNHSNFSWLELANALVVIVSRKKGWHFAGHVNVAIQT